MLVKYAKFEILDVFPRVAASLGVVTLRLSGTLIPERIKAILVESGMKKFNL